MDTKQYVIVSIGCVILLILTVGIVTPILDNVTYSQTEDNTPTGYATKVIPSGTYTWTTNGFTVNNGNEVPISINDWVLLSDSLAIAHYWNNFRIIDYKQKIQVTTQSISVDSAAGKWSVTSGTATTGDIGNNAIVRSASGELGTYRDIEFIINKVDHARMWRLAYQPVTIGGEDYIARGIISGTIDNLEVKGLNLVAGTDTEIFINSATAAIIPTSIEEVSIKADKIAANPGIRIDFNYGGNDYNFTYASGSIAAPLTYTIITGSAIESMIGIVPLLMIVGIITMLVGYFVTRRL